MRYRRLGRSGLKVSAVSIGAWLTYGGSVEEDTAQRILDAAVDRGVNFIDVADIYARGRAEEVVGRAIKGRKRSDLVISSKVFWPMSDDVNDRGLSRKHIMESVEKSLARLGTDYLDLYFCHRADEKTPLEETARAMDDLVHQGKVLYWGTSVWSADLLTQTHRLCKEERLYRPQVEQPRYNLLDRHIEAEVLPAARELGMGLVVWSPLAQGLLTGKYNDGVPEGSRGARSNWLEGDLTAENLERVRRLGALAKELGISTAQLALAWCLRLPEISSVITGATRVDQLEDNIAAADITLGEETLARIGEILS